MSENKRVVHIVWKLDNEVNEWYPVAACEDEFDAETYVVEYAHNYDVTVMYTTASVEAPLNEEA